MLLISLIHEHHIYIHICEEAKYVNLPVSLKNPCAKCFTPPIPPVLPHIPALPTVVPAQVAVSPSIRVCCPNWVRHPTMAICTFVHFHKGNSSHSGYTSYRVMIHTCMHTYIHTYMTASQTAWLPDCFGNFGNWCYPLLLHLLSKCCDPAQLDLPVVEQNPHLPFSRVTFGVPLDDLPRAPPALEMGHPLPKMKLHGKTTILLEKQNCMHTYIHTYIHDTQSYIHKTCIQTYLRHTYSRHS